MDHPEIGRIATDVRGFGVRRLLLPNTKYVLYYRVSESDRAIHVLGFWHAHRGATPRL
jgi:plasmid stabilization system protein ParE